MKLLLTILRDSDTEAVSLALVEAGFHLTRSASTGGFLRQGLTTLLIGVEDEQIETASALIRQVLGPPGATSTPGEMPGSHRAIIFVINVENFTQV